MVLKQFSLVGLGSGNRKEMAWQVGVAMTISEVHSAHQAKTRQGHHKEAKWLFSIYHLTSNIS